MQNILILQICYYANYVNYLHLTDDNLLPPYDNLLKLPRSFLKLMQK